jgi:hypothetical protein
LLTEPSPAIDDRAPCDNSPVKLRRETRILKDKAISSLRRATAAFNSYDDDGRVTTVLLHLQHAFEMLLKAALVQRRVRVFDPRLGQSIGFEKCVNLGLEHLRLSDEEAGTLRTIDAFRDDEQHWYNQLSEGLLYAHARAVVTLFDDLLQREFDDRLANYLPLRVLPISAEPPKDIQLLIDEEYQRIAELLRPGKRQRAEAKARIRSLLAMEAHAAEGVLVSRKDVSRVERAILQKKDRHHVFPRLSNLGTEITGDGLQVTVRFSKNKGAPVRLVGADDDVEAAAIREVDLQRKYHFSPAELAKHLNLSPPRTVALRRFLRIDEDPACRHDFVFGSQTHRGYSDNAVVKMRAAMTEVDMDEVWRTHGPRRRAAGALSETA